MQYKLWFDAATEEEWQPPKGLPDLSGADEIAIDLETCDPALKENGPGWATGHGHTVGIAVAVEDWKGYFPIAHETGQNMDRDQVLAWCREQFGRANQPKIFANSSYDVGWLEHEGVPVAGDWIDIQLAAPLLDEHAKTYSLNALGERYLDEKKSESLLFEAAAMFGFSTQEAKGKIHVYPPHMVGIYAEQDADLTRRLWHVMKPMLEENNLEKVFNLESRLQPHLYRMRKRGVRFNLEGAEELHKKWKIELEKLDDDLRKVDIWSARSVEAEARRLGLEDFERTATGEPSFTTQFFESTDVNFFKVVKRARKLDKGLQFIRGLSEKYDERSGRLHAQIHQLRSDDYGTVSGRFSYSHPNLQQIPTRDPEIGKPLRNLFLPERSERWISADYSSQESRILMHYVIKCGFGEGHPLVDAYREDPSADFHGLVAEQLKVSRFLAKTINLGMTYGMGKAKLAAQLGLSLSDAELSLNQYHSEFPFVRQLKKFCEERVKSKGAVSTLAGRMCRFPLFEPRSPSRFTPLPLLEATKKWPSMDLRRSFVYRSLNRLIQGGAADQNKIALLAACEAGIDVKISIHDEIAASGDESTMKDLAECMENAVELNVPTPVDSSMGDTWGDTK